MKALVASLVALAAIVFPGMSWAEGAGGYSRGNAFIYFMAIAAVLIFGINDVFRKKWLTWVSAVVIPVVFYIMLPEK